MTQVADGFTSAVGEHFSGFGGRENAVDQAGGTVETWSEEGAWIPPDRPIALPFIEPWTFSAREDGSYFPMPWLVSSRGYGFLLDDPQLSLFRLRSDRRDAWSVQADADHLDYRVFAGPRPLDVVRRFPPRSDANRAGRAVGARSLVGPIRARPGEPARAVPS